MRIAITGMGAVSAAGVGVDALADGLSRGARPFGPSRRNPVGFPVRVAEAPDAAFAAHDHRELDSPTGQLCLTAAREACADAAARGSLAPDGLVLGTSTGGQSQNERVAFALLDGEEPPAFSYRKMGAMVAPTRLVARDLDIRGPVQTLSTACTSSANAIATAAMWIRAGRCRRVLAGGGDALCFTTISTFHILGLTGEELCRPFGEDRPGLTLGEGAGFLMLEPLETVLAKGRVPLAELAGFGMSSDAHHMTAPPEDGAGAELAMRAALALAGRSPSDVALVNAHGTGTPLNDRAEAQALTRLLGPRALTMSCKGLTGHTLGGAGALEAVASVISLREGRAFANAGNATAASDCPVQLVGQGGAALPAGGCVLSNSFAFGGNNCALVFQSVGKGAAR